MTSLTANTPLLAVNNLMVSIATRNGSVQAVRGVDFTIAKGETLAIVGESGCGKSITALALMGLLPAQAQLRGEIEVAGHSLSGFSESQWRAWRGNRVAMIFQNPMTSLNPTMRIGDQIAEPLIQHQGLTRRQATRQAEQLLARLRISQPTVRMRQYPFEFSGGMLQRVMIAIAIACDPALLIADEPTTALDVTVQAEVLSLLKELQAERGMALLLISHDLAVVSQVADRVAVMYAGKLLEQADVGSIFSHPEHPYTQGLKRALPAFDDHDRRALTVIAGSPPDLLQPPSGCGFYPRCQQAMQICQRQAPPRIQHTLDHYSDCWLSVAASERAG